jgi:hypothetical protein
MYGVSNLTLSLLGLRVGFFHWVFSFGLAMEESVRRVGENGFFPRIGQVVFPFGDGFWKALVLRFLESWGAPFEVSSSMAVPLLDPEGWLRWWCCCRTPLERVRD